MAVEAASEETAENLLAQLLRGGHAAGIGHEAGAHAGHGVRLLAGMGDGQRAMALDERPLAPERHRLRDAAGVEVLADFPKNPGCGHGAAPQHHAGDAGLPAACDGRTSALVRSPLPMTGISTAWTTCAITSQSASPL